MLVITRKENPFPEDLDERLGAVLNVVNTELKSVTLLHLDDKPSDRFDIKAKLRETVGMDCYLPGSETVECYCQRSLFPIGMVAKEDVIRETVGKTYLGYSLTPAGTKYGLPAAVFSLLHSAKTGTSMFKILASTNSHGKTRAPLSRVKALKELKQGNLRLIDLVKKLELAGSSVLPMIRDFENIGFVHYDSTGEISANQVFVNYSWVEGKKPEDALAVKTCVQLTKDIANAIFERSGLDRNEIRRLIGDCDKIEVSRVLSGLEKQGFLRRGRWKSGETMSEIRLLDKGRIFLDEFVEPLTDALSDGESLHKMREQYESLTNSSDEQNKLYRQAISTYKRVSPYINSRSTEENTDRVLNLLRENPGIRPVDIKRFLQRKSTSALLTPLVNGGAIRKEKHGRETRYYINEK